MEAELEFLRSTRCNEGAGCVGVARTGSAAYVRDLKEPDGPVLQFSPDEWRAFVDAVKVGDFD